MMKLRPAVSKSIKKGARQVNWSREDRAFDKAAANRRLRHALKQYIQTLVDFDEDTFDQPHPLTSWDVA